jgi:hypothetical protein
MNIFFLDRSPRVAALYHVDKHVVKMILETAQLLSTAHRVLDGQLVVSHASGRKKTAYVLPDDRENHLYKATHINHPSAIWCRSGLDQYRWTYDLFVHLTMEYTYRYGKHHKCEFLLDPLWEAPKNIDLEAPWTEATPAMPDECKVPGDSVESYRNYYIQHKNRMGKWTNRAIPTWYKHSEWIKKHAEVSVR